MQICMPVTFRIVGSKVLTLGGNLPYLLCSFEILEYSPARYPFRILTRLPVAVGEPAGGLMKLIQLGPSVFTAHGWFRCSNLGFGGSS